MFWTERASWTRRSPRPSMCAEPIASRSVSVKGHLQVNKQTKTKQYADLIPSVFGWLSFQYIHVAVVSANNAMMRLHSFHWNSPSVSENVNFVYICSCWISNVFFKKRCVVLCSFLKPFESHHRDLMTMLFDYGLIVLCLPLLCLSCLLSVFVWWCLCLTLWFAWSDSICSWTSAVSRQGLSYPKFVLH